MLVERMNPESKRILQMESEERKVDMVPMGGRGGCAPATSESSFSPGRQNLWLLQLTHTRLQEPKVLDDNRLDPKSRASCQAKTSLPSQKLSCPLRWGQIKAPHPIPISVQLPLGLVFALAPSRIIQLSSLFILPQGCRGLVL